MIFLLLVILKFAAIAAGGAILLFGIGLLVWYWPIPCAVAAVGMLAVRWRMRRRT